MTATKKQTGKKSQKTSAQPAKEASVPPLLDQTEAGKTAAKTPAHGKKQPAKTKPQRHQLSALDAAAKVLAESAEPMTTRQMIDAMAAKGYWTSPGGATPHATLYSAILREMTVKNADARFLKTERGKFALKS